MKINRWFFSMLLSLTWTTSAYATNFYHAQDLGTLALFDGAEPIDMNNHSTILIRGSKDIYCIWEPTSGLTQINLENLPKQAFRCISDSGSVFGYLNNKLIIWERQSGSKKIEIISDKYSIIVGGCNTNNAVLGVYALKGSIINGGGIFLYSNNSTKTLQYGQVVNSRINHQNEEIEIWRVELPVAIQNDGIALCFASRWIKHPYKEKWIKPGLALFLWDGIVTTLIDLPNGASLHECYGFAPNGKVAMSIVWEDGSISYGEWNQFTGYEAQDYEEKKLPEPAELQNMSDISSLYPGSDILEIRKINATGDILVQACFYNELHPFLLSPSVQDSSPNKINDNIRLE